MEFSKCMLLVLVIGTFTNHREVSITSDSPLFCKSKFTWTQFRTIHVVNLRLYSVNWAYSGNKKYHKDDLVLVTIIGKTSQDLK